MNLKIDLSSPKTYFNFVKFKILTWILSTILILITINTSSYSSSNACSLSSSSMMSYAHYVPYVRNHFSEICYSEIVVFIISGYFIFLSLFIIIMDCFELRSLRSKISMKNVNFLTLFLMAIYVYLIYHWLFGLSIGDMSRGMIGSGLIHGGEIISPLFFSIAIPVVGVLVLAHFTTPKPNLTSQKEKSDV